MRACRRAEARQNAVAAIALGTVLAISPAVLAYPTVYPSGVTINEPGAAEGYALVTAGSDVHLLDADGTILHVWDPDCGLTYVARPLDDGHILIKSCGSGGSMGGLDTRPIVELDWDGNIVWEFASPTDVDFHHDWERLPNGNTMILARQSASYPLISDRSILDDFILEVSPAGDVVWEWHLPDHFDELNLSQETKDFIFAKGGDWAHPNSISRIPDDTSHTDPRFAPGNVIISIRHHGVGVIDRATDEIVWIFNDSIVGQHNAQMIPDSMPGGGNIIAFDNGWVGRWAEFANRFNRDHSLIVEIDPATDTIVYTYDAEQSELPLWTFFSSFGSGVQRLPNGNTFICEGGNGRVFEITPAGEVVWEYVNPFRNPAEVNSNSIYRAYKVPVEWAGSHFANDLVLSGNDDADPVPAGGSITYTLQLQNGGPDPAVNATLSGSTPLGTTFQSISAPPGWSCSTPSAGSTGPFSCDSPSLSSGSIRVFTMSVGVDLCVADGTPIIIGPTASSDGTESAPADNTVTIQTPVTGTDCTDTDICTVDSCDPMTNQCVHTPGVCMPLDACHLAGVCDPATGCSNPVAMDGTLCDDADPLTCDDLCTAGVCGGTPGPRPDEVNDSLTVSPAGAEGATIAWNDTPGEFNVYRGTIIPVVPFTYDHACLNPTGPLTTMSLADQDEPALGTVYYYLVTRVEECRESYSGPHPSGGPRTDPHPCPDTGTP